MIQIVVANQLLRFFPSLKDRQLAVEATTAAEAIRAVDLIAPGFADYVLDERGSLRRHVSVFIGEEMVIDRQSLSDRIPPGGTVYVFQALSGG
jgi:molybdopterin synthase sulfur carrier subunit